MLSILDSLYEEDKQTGDVMLKQGVQTDMKVYKDDTPDGDKIDQEIKKNKLTGPTKIEGKIDPKAAPPNPEVAYQYVNTPLSRITKTRM